MPAARRSDCVGTPCSSASVEELGGVVLAPLPDGEPRLALEDARILRVLVGDLVVLRARVVELVLGLERGAEIHARRALVGLLVERGAEARLGVGGPPERQVGLAELDHELGIIGGLRLRRLQRGDGVVGLAERGERVRLGDVGGG